MRTWKRSWIRLNCNKVLSLIGLSTKAGKSCQRRVFNGESSKDRKGLAGHRFSGSIGQYQKEIP